MSITELICYLVLEPNRVGFDPADVFLVPKATLDDCLNQIGAFWLDVTSYPSPAPCQGLSLAFVVTFTPLSTLAPFFDLYGSDDFFSSLVAPVSLFCFYTSSVLAGDPSISLMKLTRSPQSNESLHSSCHIPPESYRSVI